MGNKGGGRLRGGKVRRGQKSDDGTVVMRETGVVMRDGRANSAGQKATRVREQRGGGAQGKQGVKELGDGELEKNEKLKEKAEEWLFALFKRR